jgi:cytochrome c peroxidase
MAWKQPLTPGSSCGPTGLSVDADDGSVVAFCSLTRKTVRLTPSGNTAAVGTPSAELAKSHMSASAQRGAEIFRRGNSSKMSSFGAMACANCHPESRADGLSWFLTGNILQTPFLSGRVMDAHPYKWDGKDANLEASLTNTVKRLGGSGLNKRDVQDLTAFLAASPTPRTPTVEDHESVARGKELFESDATGCADCHFGALLTDQKRHEIAADLPAVDTPSLIGLANSAPYYHDGSAATLGALLRGKGNIHGMGRTSKLSDGQIGDLVAYMETL